MYASPKYVCVCVCGIGYKDLFSCERLFEKIDDEFKMSSFK